MTAHALDIRAHTEQRSRIRKTNAHVFEVTLPVETALSIRLAAAKAGLTPEQLITDILRDSFEPVFASRGKLAAEAVNAGSKDNDP
jgi:hypothetical protein